MPLEESPASDTHSPQNGHHFFLFKIIRSDVGKYSAKKAKKNCCFICLVISALFYATVAYFEYSFGTHIFLEGGVISILLCCFSFPNFKMNHMPVFYNWSCHSVTDIENKLTCHLITRVLFVFI